MVAQVVVFDGSAASAALLSDLGVRWFGIVLAGSEAVFALIVDCGKLWVSVGVGDRVCVNQNNEVSVYGCSNGQI